MRLTKDQRGRNVLTVVCGLLVGQSFAGVQATVQGDEIQIGKPAPVVAASMASGIWTQRYPFDPKTYGKVRGTCPVSSPEPKIVLYTRTLDKNFFASPPPPMRMSRNIPNCNGLWWRCWTKRAHNAAVIRSKRCRRGSKP